MEKTIYIKDDILNSFESDSFGHRYFCEAIVESIKSSEPPFTIGIFGSWGTGKSSLIRNIENILKKDKRIRTINLDAWRYINAENLKRVFLIHVAKILKEDSVEVLQQKLYSNIQHSEKKNDELNGKDKWNLKFLWNKFKLQLFSVLQYIFFFTLICIFFLVILGVAQVISKGFISIELLVSNFLSFLFIPVFITLIDGIKDSLKRPQVTILDERIDAEEVFSEYFNSLVKNEISSKEKLVIFIDNLDRLSNSKMIEALESLKTYIDNKRCIFVVACDENVVRKAIDSHTSNLVDSNPAISQYQSSIFEGEHYLDKFFQQTFRLPEFLDSNLLDFAILVFNTTKLSEELFNNGINIEHLVSIILPTDIKSPRKVKRLLNEFISLYEIVKRKENDEAYPLQKGLITGEVYFLAKISTIRAEYSEFYKRLQDDPELLTYGVFNVEDKIVENKSLLSYLNKTKNIFVEEIEPFIWLTQDKYEFGISQKVTKSLKTSLSNGDFLPIKMELHKPEQGAQLNRSMPHSLTGACRTPKPE